MGPQQTGSLYTWRLHLLSERTRVLRLPWSSPLRKSIRDSKLLPNNPNPIYLINEIIIRVVTRRQRKRLPFWSTLDSDSWWFYPFPYPVISTSAPKLYAPVVWSDATLRHSIHIPTHITLPESMDCSPFATSIPLCHRKKKKKKPTKGHNPHPRQKILTLRTEPYASTKKPKTSLTR